MIPVIVISLRRSETRRASMQAHLGGLGVPFRFFDAVDGERMRPDEVAALDIRPIVVKYGRLPTAGEIGLAASFLGVLREIADGSAPWVCVLEDDARLLDGATDFLAEATLAGLPAFDVLRLYVPRASPPAWAVAVGDVGGKRVSAPLNTYDGTVGQVISRKAAIRLLRHLRPLRAPVDNLIFRDPPFGFRILEVRPKVVWVDMSPSVIGRRLETNNDGRRMPRRVAAKMAFQTFRRARRVPSFIAAWGPAMAWRLAHLK